MIKTNKKAMLLHTFPGERTPLTQVKCVYVGDGGGNKKADIAIAEAPLFDFDSALSTELGWPFDILSAYAHVPQLIIALPNSFHVGKGKGYILDLMDFAKDQGYSVFNAKVRFHQFGAPIYGTSMFMVCSHELMNPPKSFTTNEVPAGKWFPEIITHANGVVNNIAFVNGAGAMNGFIKSNTSPFPEVALWGNNLLMIERQQGNTVVLGRLTLEEVSKIYGMAITDNEGLAYLPKAVPQIVYDTFIKRFLLD